MLCGVRLVNALGISGVPFAGYDVGGFAGEAGPNLFAKWIVLGAFSPLFRCHSMINSKDAEPWAFGEETEEISRNYIGLRYRLLPYIYSTFYESTQNGIPVARSLAIKHTFDAQVYEPRFQNQYYFGHAFLIPPVESNKDFAKIYLPEGNWYDLHNGKQYKRGEHIIELRNERYPLFVIGGSIIPMQSLVQSTSEQPEDLLELHVYNASNNNAFIYYEDDGNTLQYAHGEYYKRSIRFLPGNKQIVIEKAEGKFKSKFSYIKLILHGFGKIRSLNMNNKALKLKNSAYQYIQPVSSFDPFYKSTADDMKDTEVAYTVFENIDNEIKISW
jgi:alpha-glucosidase